MTPGIAFLVLLAAIVASLAWRVHREQSQEWKDMNDASEAQADPLAKPYPNADPGADAGGVK